MKLITTASLIPATLRCARTPTENWRPVSGASGEEIEAGEFFQVENFSKLSFYAFQNVLSKFNQAETLFLVAREVSWSQVHLSFQIVKLSNYCLNPISVALLLY